MYDTSEYVEDEGIKAEIESVGTNSYISSYWNGRDEQNQDYQIKKESFYDSQSWNSEIKTEANVDRADRTTLESIKHEEIDLKYEPVENLSGSSCGNEEMMETDSCNTSSKNVPWNRSYLGQHENLSFTDNPRHILEHNYSLNVNMYTSDKQHRLLCSGTSQDKILTCVSCHFKTKSLVDLKKHTLIHLSCRKIYTCDLCSFTTHWKIALNSHQSSHRKLTEATFYKCDRCEFKSKWKNKLKRHELIHKDPLEVKVHKCKFFSLATNCKFNLKSHMLTDINSFQKKALKSDKSGYSNIIYKCIQCYYFTKYIKRVNDHVQVHDEPPKINHFNSTIGSSAVIDSDSITKKFKCNLCNYRVHSQYLLNMHLLVHTKLSEACNKCGYKTRWRYSLRGHQSVRASNKKENIQMQQVQVDAQHRFGKK